jgi:dihydrofolate reductase
MINMIVAVSKNGVIGKDGALPWRIPEDLRAFKELTMGGILYVGKKTASTLPPLKGREVVVLGRETFPTLLDVKALNKPAWIIGGAAIYNAALELDIVDRIYVTLIDKEYDGDTFFSFEQLKKISALPWKLVSERILRENDPLVTLQEWSRE